MRTHKIPAPFQYRGRWRAQPTLKNGMRPFKDFDTFGEADAWLQDQRRADTDKEPVLGGPTAATLADMLVYYAEHYSLKKLGVEQELNRINHYLAGAGRPELAVTKNDLGQLEVVPLHTARERKARLQKDRQDAQSARVGGNTAGEVPCAFANHTAKRVASHPRTYAMYAELAKKRASQLTRNDMERLQTAMTAEKYSNSTIQKEIALLKAMFNVAREKWDWRAFENPCSAIKLAKAGGRFVVVTSAQRASIFEALGQCDNPEIWTFVALTLETTQRKHSLHGLVWEKIDLEARVAQVWAKGDWAVVPLSKQAVLLLENLPGDRTGRVFHSTMDALQSAWKGVREKAGLPQLRVHDLRHVGATDFARAGMNSHQLQRVLAQKTDSQAKVYVNLVHSDILNAMDAMPDKHLPMPPAVADRNAAINQNKARRLNAASSAEPPPKTVPVEPAPQHSGNVVAFPGRFARATVSEPPLGGATGTM